MTSLRYASGFTLIEALLAILILLVAIGIGAPSFIEFRQNQQITGVGQALLVDLQLAALLIKSKVGWSLPHPPGGLS